jgi:carbamoyltransferase-like protein
VVSRPHGVRPSRPGKSQFLSGSSTLEYAQLLNEKIKLREWFRPLAPSLLEEASRDVFGAPHQDPFMVTVLPVAGVIPAVVHVDHTARPQTVSKRVNPRFWRLIREFDPLTVLLNSSFKIQEPIVCTPEHATKAFRNASFRCVSAGEPSGLALLTSLILVTCRVPVVAGTGTYRPTLRPAVCGGAPEAPRSDPRPEGCQIRRHILGPVFVHARPLDENEE